jgi:hypothetical protein
MIMRKIAILVSGLFFCQPAFAIELISSEFSADPYRTYFTAHFAELPPADEGVAFNLFPEDVCVILPPSHERFRFAFNPDGGNITESPEVTTVGEPALDRWWDGPADHLALNSIDFLEWTISGSIINGQDGLLPGDRLCMRIDYPGGSHGYSGLLIEETPEAGIQLSKTSTTRLATHAGQVIPYSYRIENVSPVYIHDVLLTDDNVDDPPVCAFSGNDELAPEGQPNSTVFCTAQHTVTQDEIEAETVVSNTATVTADELGQVTTELNIPVAVFASGFESPPNLITSLDTPAGNGDIAIGADDRPVIAYRDAISNDLKVAKCLDVECTAVYRSLVYGGAQEYSDPSIAIGNDGLPIISFWDRTNGLLLVAKCNDDGCGGGDEAVTLVDEGNVGQHSSIAIGSGGLPIISYYDAANGKLKVASCNDAACSGEDEIITTLNDAESSTGFNTSIAIGADGFPVISYQRSVTPWDGTLKVAKCNDASCVGGDETITTLDTTGGPVFESTSLAVGLDGNPVIAYMSDGTVTVVKCNDPACAGADETFTAIFSTTYGRLSITLGTDGNPVISFPGSPLNVAKCNDPACAGEDESIATVGTGGAGSPSIAIGVDGLPIVSYLDGNPGVLKVVHCGTQSCD